MTLNISADTQTFPYMYGAHITWVSATTLRVQPALCRNSTNLVDINLGNYFETGATNTTVDAETNGANGLDTGSLANNTWYALFIIGSSTNSATPSLLLSASVSSPLLPDGFDCFRRIGWARTNGSAEILKFLQTGSGGKEYYQWDVPINVLSAGSSATFATVSLASAVPPQTTPVHINISYTPAAAANTASIRPSGSSAAAGSTPIVVKGTTNGVAIHYPTTTINPAEVDDVIELEYIVTASDALTIDVAGFEDYTS
jgi:hypothetical protein